jgi:hypothetical protein
VRIAVARIPFAKPAPSAHVCAVGSVPAPSGEALRLAIKLAVYEQNYAPASALHDLVQCTIPEANRLNAAPLRRSHTERPEVANGEGRTRHEGRRASNLVAIVTRSASEPAFISA